VSVLLKLDPAEAEPNDGFDACIIIMPPELYAEGELLLPAAKAALAQVAAKAAAEENEILHHAEWRITGNVEEVKQFGTGDNCEQCRAGTERGVAFLNDNPGRELAIGKFWWARW